MSTFCTYVFTVNPPRITTHPQELRDAVPGKVVRFTAVATGTQPLRYQWEWKPPGEAVGESSENEVWQSCNVESFPGADNSTVIIPSVQKSNEGNYRCVISNCAGSQTSNPAELSVGKINVDSLNDTFVLHVHRGFLRTCS